MANEVKVSDVAVGAVCGVAPLRLEACAWIVAQAADRLREIGFGEVGADEVFVDDEGSVTVRPRAPSDDATAARSLRAVLDALLQVASDGSASLASKLRLAACRPDGAGLALLARELDGALGGSDPAALAKEIARLARATFESVAEGKIVEDEAPEGLGDWSGVASTIALRNAAESTPVVDPPPAPPSRPSVAVAIVNDDVRARLESIAEEHARAVDSVRAQHESSTAQTIAVIQAEWERRVALARAEGERRALDTERDRDRRIKELTDDHERRLRAVEADASRRIAALEADRDRRILSAERAMEDAEERHRRAMEETIALHDTAMKEADSRRTRVVDGAVEQIRRALDAERTRAIADLSAAHEAALLALRAEWEAERRALQARVDALEYALARAHAERDAERTLRVDAEVSAANRMRELRRVNGRLADEPRPITYRDVDDDTTTIAASSSRRGIR